MNHLGERLSALVDGELGHAERDRALAHLAVCESCRFEADMLRRLKRRLTRLDPPEPSSDFMGRLAALSGLDAPPPDDRFDPPPAPSSRGFLSGLRRRDPGGGPSGPLGTTPPLGSSRPLGEGRPLGWGHPLGGSSAADSAPTALADPPADEAPHDAIPAPRSRPRWAQARYALAGASVVGFTLGTAFVAGGQGDRAPVVTPPLADYAVEHAVTSRQASLADPVSMTAVGLTVAPAVQGDRDGAAEVLPVDGVARVGESTRR
ncbi:Putative zinc-finger [Marinactinospora thermotolerans DSM 45154]|uniref:Putative zinc-finger n=1 Tax=Marinactinospora thermotolerans DSM 45154 TaxID=1122192 RepID=A0A1T4SWP6_9ACTN|nr:zf-HC2 domain-containing protein [Marinactinospora thermotolerans]SKA32684.1 Putative zinc-finger [Marinactinospora thermotolerans DSM 45154]